MAILCKKCPNLQDLNLADNVLITSESLPSISKLKYLNKLDLSRCYIIEPASFISLNFLQVFHNPLINLSSFNFSHSMFLVASIPKVSNGFEINFLRPSLMSPIFLQLPNPRFVHFVNSSYYFKLKSGEKRL